jgi:DNA-binding transcriptional LysR family regulator
MEIRRLKYFLQIAEEGSMCRAANVLGIAQPALSRQVRLLETQLGVPLFIRSQRGVQLTEDGEQLRAALRRPMRDIELALQNVGAPSSPIEAIIVLGMSSATANILVLPFLKQASAAFPNVKFSIIDRESGELIEGLIRGEIDIALVHGPLPDERLFEQDILSEDLMLVGGPATRLEPTTPVTFLEMSQHPLVLPRHHHQGVRAILEKTALRINAPIQVVLEMDSLQLTKELVESNTAFTIMPFSAFGREHELGRLRYAPIRDPVLTQTLFFAVRQHLVVPRRFVWELGILVSREVARLVASKAWPATVLYTPP